MFLLRLKTEFAENLKLVLALWLALGVIVWSFFDWWLAPLDGQGNEGIMGGIAILAVGAIVFFLVSTMFKRDDLKHPQDFWATRPIRAFIFFGAKLVFAWLAVVLPVGVLATVLGFVAGIGGQAIWHGLETMLWAGFVTSLLALSCMAFPGGGRSLLCKLAYFGGVIVTCIILSNVESLPWRSYSVSETRIGWNLLVMLCLLTAGFIWQGVRQIRDKHRRQNPAFFVATGILTVFLVTFVPLPGGLSNLAITSKANTSPKVTKAKVSLENMTFGHKDGAAFVSMSIELIPDEPISGDALEFTDADIRVTDPNGIPQRVEISHMASMRLTNTHGVIGHAPTLDYYVFERQPGSRSGMSSGSDHEKSGIVASLPRKKIRISGRMTLNGLQYRTIHRSTLTQPFAIKESGMRVAFINSPDRHTGRESSVIWKAYMPPLVTSLSGYRQDMVRFRLEHSPSHDLHWYDRLEGGGSGGGAFFGPY
ncbi:MAG TPA: hypothetical protein VLO11_13145, partial [Luteolibacter sp.]|nr:hypothetical protein [Luteolibacter sp.]